MTTQQEIDDLTDHLAVVLRDIRTALTGSPGEAASNAAAVAARLGAAGFAAPDIENALYELEAEIQAATLTNTDGLAEGTSNLYFTDLRVLNAPLTGYVQSNVSTTLTSADSVLVAIQRFGGFLERLGNFSVDDSISDPDYLWSSEQTQAAIDAIAIATTDGLTEGVTNLYFTDERSIASPLTGFVATTGSVAPTDTILMAFGKLQGQIDNIDLAGIIDDTVTASTSTWSSQEIDNRIQGVIDAAPAALDTLNEIAAALGDDANFAATVTNQLSDKANAVDVYTRAQLGADFESRDWAARLTAALV